MGYLGWPASLKVISNVIIQQSAYNLLFTFYRNYASILHHLYPCDAMLLQYQLWPVFIPLSITSQCSIEMAGQIKLVFGIEATLGCVIREFQYLQKQSNYLWNFVANSGLKFCQSTLTMASVVNLLQLTTVASLSHWVSTFMYNTMGVMQHVEWFCLWQLRLVKL